MGFTISALFAAFGLGMEMTRLNPRPWLVGLGVGLIAFDLWMLWV